MNNKKSISVVLITIIVVIIGAVVFTFWKTKTANDELRVGYMRISSHAAFIYALENDVFSKHNLKIKGEYYPTTADLIAALENKRIDVAFQVTPEMAWLSANKVKDHYYVYFSAESTEQKPMDGFYALTTLTKDSLLNSKIGCFPSPTAKIMTRMIMEKFYNLKEAEYELIEVRPDLQLTFMENKNIKALFTYEPIGTIIKDKIKAREIIHAPVETVLNINPWYGGVGIFSKDLVEKRKNVAINFQNAIEESFHILNNSKNVDIYAKTMLKLQPGINQDLAKQIPNISLTFSNANNIDDIRGKIDRLFSKYQEYEILEKKVNPFLEIFNPKDENER
jgi:ABC-type nitrate/sulfonate/bicarbonate transport system substrate-binding protein